MHLIQTHVSNAILKSRLGEHYEIHFGHVGIIFIILVLFRVFSTLLRFSLDYSVGVFFSFDYFSFDYFQEARMLFVLFFFNDIFFSRYQFVEFAKCTIIYLTKEL